MDTKLLLVEDDEDTAEILRIMLMRAGYTVRLASDGLTALEAVTDFAPDMALIDIGLPELDGLQVARLLQARHPRAVLVCMTGRNDLATRQAAHRAGFILHIAKPIDASSLPEELQSALVAGRAGVR